jgi:hypothetical protein
MEPGPTDLDEQPQERHRRDCEHHNMRSYDSRVSQDKPQSLESAGDRIDDALKLLRLLLARLRSGATHLEPRHCEQRQGCREVPKYPIEIDHAITPLLKLAPPSQAGAFAPPSLPRSHLPTVVGAPSKVRLQLLSAGPLNSRRCPAGTKHLPITFRPSQTPSDHLPSTFRIRGDASGHRPQAPPDEPKGMEAKNARLEGRGGRNRRCDPARTLRSSGRR